MGRHACHWDVEGELTLYDAKVEQFKAKLKAGPKYRIAYWLHSESYENALDEDVSVFTLAIDLLHGDFVFC